MDFSITEEQKELVNSVYNFAAKQLSNDFKKVENNTDEIKKLWLKCAEFGIQGLPFPISDGGAGQDLLSTVLALEALGYSWRNNGLLFSINAQMWSVQMPIFKYGSAEQKKKYLSDLINGSLIGAHAMSEPGSGSDAFSLTSNVKKRGKEYLLNGTKIFSTNGPIADIFIVFATENNKKGLMGISAFIVEKNFKGVHVGKNFAKMGLKSSPWSEVFFEDCIIPEENRLGKSGYGAIIFNDSMEWERSFILASYIGTMQRQLEKNIEYVQSRKQFGQSIGKFQSVANRIADMKVRLETCRLLLYKTAWTKQETGHAALDSVITKLYISECFVKSGMDSIRNFGGYGYSEEYEVEVDLRDSIGTLLFSGTSDIQKVLIAKHLGL